jgi:hypothetical protein
MLLTEEVMSEGQGLRLLGELVHDKVLPSGVEPVFDNLVGYSIDQDGKVVMDTTVITVMQVKEISDAIPHSRKRKH